MTEDRGLVAAWILAGSGGGTKIGTLQYSRRSSAIGFVGILTGIDSPPRQG